MQVQIWVYLKTGVMLKSTWDDVEDGATEESVRMAYSNVCDPDELCEISGINMTVLGHNGIFDDGMEVAILASAVVACALKFKYD